MQGTYIGQRYFHRWLAPTLKELKRRKERMGPRVPNHRNTYLEWNYNAELYAFGKRLGENFNKDLLQQALTEKSYLIQEEKKQLRVGIEPGLNIDDNSVLVDKGKELISRYVEKYLLATLPKLPKQHTLSIHDYLLSEELLAHVSKSIGTDDIIMCADFPVKNETLARVLKSLTWALLLSSGEDRASLFIRDFIVTQLAGKDLTTFCMPEKPMEILQDSCKKGPTVKLESRLLGTAGQNTLLAAYLVGIYADRKLIGKGFGETISIAENMAACDALWKQWGVSSSKKPFPYTLELPPLPSGP